MKPWNITYGMEELALKFFLVSSRLPAAKKCARYNVSDNYSLLKYGVFFNWKEIAVTFSERRILKLKIFAVYDK